MAKKSVLDKIAQGIGLEDAEVLAYVKERKAKRDARIERYRRVDSLIKELK